MSTTVTLSCNHMNFLSKTNKTTNYQRNSLNNPHEWIYGNDFVVDFNSLSNIYYYKDIESAYLCAVLSTTASNFYADVYRCTTSWNPATITYSSRGGGFIKTDIGILRITQGTAVTASALIYNHNVTIIRDILNYGALLATDWTGSIYTGSSNAPYFQITFSSSNAYLSPADAAPSSGYIPKTSDNTFTWTSSQTGSCVGELAVTNCKFRWRPNSSAAYTEINCGTAMTYTVPANTFTTDEIQWSVVITDNGGTTTSSDWYTLSTGHTEPTATINYPKNIMLNGTEANEFSWNHITGTGLPPTQSVLQKSVNGTTWTSLATVTGSSTTTTIPADTFTSGQWYWRVQTYDTDSMAGAWSDAAPFVVLNSPLVQGVTSTQTPRPLVAWQCTDQQGYQVKIGVYDSGVKYGTAQSFKYPYYLADGTYEVKVRAVNQYGLWSAWVTASCTVSNTAGADINLSVSHSNAVAELVWDTTGTYTSYVVYRNNVPIYNGTDTFYTDNLALGNVTYKVRGITTGSDNYTFSNVEDVLLEVDAMMIADIGTFSWMRLDKSQSTECEINLSHKNSSKVEHISGATYPVIEFSEYRDKILSGRVAFTDVVDAKNFAQLNGKCVVVKTHHSDMVIGLLSSISEVQNTFFYGFSFSVQHTFLLEEVDI